MDEITITEIRDKIYTIRGQQVMLDFDLAKIYGYETKNFNRQVKNNTEKFPADMMFQLKEEDLLILSRCKNFTTIMQRPGMKGGRVYFPYAFTEQGIYMLMTVLKGDLATKQSIALVRLFKEMKQYISDNARVFQRLNSMETHLVEHDDKISYLFKQLEQPKPNSVNIFFKGQMWDALSCIEEIISKAKDEIILIDGYVDKSTLDVLSKKKNKIPVTIITYKQNCKLTDKEIEDFSVQYGKLTVRYSNEFHDRFLILDKKELYHIGASIKDAGKKGFAVILEEERDLIELLLSKI